MIPPATFAMGDISIIIIERYNNKKRIYKNEVKVKGMEWEKERFVFADDYQIDLLDNR